MAVSLTAEEKSLRARIQAARSDRARHQNWINEALRLGLPTYRRLGESTSITGRAEEQDDLFDTTLQTTIEDFASDMISTFTPRHERWVTFAASEDLSEGQRREIEPQLKAISDSIFAEIERSNYWDAAQECFANWSIAAMAVAVSDNGPLNPLHFQPIEIPDLLLERGADGTVTGKWREMKLTATEQNQMWGSALPNEFPLPPADKKDKKAVVIEGCDRDYSTPGVERWHWRILVDGKEKYRKTYEGAGSCPIVACRFRQQADSAWGPGPAHKATPAARTLDELAYLNLKALGRAVDPPFSYEEDGMANYEGGIEPGRAFPRAAGSKAPEMMTPDVRFDASYFESDRERLEIKKALYQDRPDQPGKTPPTAAQWGSEEAWNTRRKELPRDRCVREWVLPIIERVAWIKSQRGELPPVKLKGGRLVQVTPISPLSKAKDLEDISVTGQVLSMAGLLGTALQVGVPVDAKATMLNVIRTAKERHIVMKSDEQVQMEQAAAMAAQAGVDVGAMAGGEEAA